MSLYIACFHKGSVVQRDGKSLPIALGNPLFGAVLAVSGVTQQSAALLSATDPSDVYFARLYADEACHVVIGGNPVATTGSFFKLGAGQTEWIGIPSGQKIAVIAGV